MRSQNCEKATISAVMSKYPSAWSNSAPLKGFS